MPGIDLSRLFLPLSVAVLTVSDSRSLADDRSGDTLADRLTAAGHGLADRAVPQEAEVAVSGPDRFARDRVRLDARSVDVQLPIAEAVVAEPVILLVNLSTEHIAIEGVRALPIGHGNHAVVDDDAWQHPTDGAKPRALRAEQATEASSGPVLRESPERTARGAALPFVCHGTPA